MILLLFCALQDVDSLIDKLSSDEVEERENAAAALEQKGPAALPTLRRRLTPALEEEAAARLRKVIRRVARPTLEAVRTVPLLEGFKGGLRWVDAGRKLALIEGDKLVLRPAGEGERTTGPAAREMAVGPSGDLIALADRTGIRMLSASTLKAESEVAVDSPWGLHFAGKDRICFADGSKLRRMQNVDGAWKQDAVEAPRTVWHSDALVLAISPDGGRMALGAALSDTANVLDLESRKVAGPIRFKNPDGGIFVPRARFSPDSRLLAVAGPGEVRVLHAASLEEIVAIVGHRLNTVFDFTADSGYLVLADGSLRVRDCVEALELASKGIDLGRTEYVESVACSPAGSVACVVRDYRGPQKGPDRLMLFKLVFP